MAPRPIGHDARMHDHETHGIRGDRLAEDAGGPPGGTPDPDDLARGGIRGDGLADDGSGPPGTPDPSELGRGGVRGDGLAEGD